MRIAVCLSGSPRYIKEGFFFTKKHIITENCDVFAHAWNCSEQEKSDILQLYIPKLWCFDLQPIPIEGRGNGRSMFRSIQKCNELKCKYENELGFKYDIVVRHRFDNIMMHKYEFGAIDGNCVYLETHTEHFDDRFAFGNSSMMDIYSQAFDYVTVDKINNSYAEKLLKKYLQNLNVPIKHMKYDGFIARERNFPYYTYPDAENILNQIR